jgi:NitT/TauT family transport system substrate-binding protein
MKPPDSSRSSDAAVRSISWQMAVAGIGVLFAAIALVIWLASGFQGRTNESGASTRVGIATWPGFAPVFLARQRGYFDGVDVSAAVVDDFTARQSAFISGQHDFTIYTIDSLAFDAGKGVRGRIVMVLDRSNGADGIVVRHGITNPADLRGKRVAYTRGSPAHFLLVNVLREAGLSISDIQTVEVDDPTRAAEAFLAGSVDAAVTWEPYLSQIRSSNRGTVLVDTRTMPNRIIDVLVASPRVVQERPQVVQAVVHGWLRALDEIRQPRGDTYRIMAGGLGMPEAEFRGNAAGVLFATREMNREWLASSPEGASRADQLFRQAAEIWRQERLSESPLSPAGFIDNRFILRELQLVGADGGR